MSNSPAYDATLYYTTDHVSFIRQGITNFCAVGSLFYRISAIFNDLEWHWKTSWNIQSHEAFLDLISYFLVGDASPISIWIRDRGFQLQLPLPSSETLFQCCGTASWLLVSASSRNHLFYEALYFHWFNSTKRKVYCWLTCCVCASKISNTVINNVTLRLELESIR